MKKALSILLLLMVTELAISQISPYLSKNGYYYDFAKQGYFIKGIQSDTIGSKEFWYKLDKEDKSENDPSHLLPNKEFNKIINSSINRYLLLKANSTNIPAVSVDFVAQQINLGYMQAVKNHELNYVGFNLSADYSTESSQSSIYSNGQFVNNIGLTLKWNHFFNGSGKFTSIAKPAIRQIIFDKIKSIDAKFLMDKEILEKINSTGQNQVAPPLCEPKCIDEAIKKLAEQQMDIFKLSANRQENLLDNLQKKHDDDITAVFEDPLIYNSKRIHWLSFSLPLGTPSYKIYDESKPIGSRLGSKRVVKAGVDVAYNSLKQTTVSNNIFYYSISVGFAHQANLDDIKSKDFTEQTIIATSPLGSSFIEKKATAYYKDDLYGKGIANLSTDIIRLFGKSSIGGEEIVQYQVPAIINAHGKSIITNNLGFLFPVKNKKDDAITIIKIYWQCSGQRGEKFDNVFGFKVGLPINVK